MWRKLILFVVLCATVGGLHAQLEITSANSKLELAGHLSVNAKSDLVNTPQEALALYRSGRFQALPGFLGRGYVQAPLWLAFDMQSKVGAPESFHIQVGPAVLDHVTAWQADADGQLTLLGIAGDQVPLDEVAIPALRPNFALRLAAGTRSTVLLRIETIGPQTAIVKLHQTEHFPKAQALESMVLGVESATYLMMGFAALGLFWVLRDRVYLLWLILIVVMTGQAFMVSGLGYLYLDWADLRYVNKITNGFTVLTIGMNVLFASTLFSFQALHRWLHRSIAIWLVLTLAFLSYAIWHSLWFFRGLALNAALMMMVAFVGIVGQMLRRDLASLRYGPMFLLSFAAGMVTVLAINGTLVAYSELTASTWRAGSICNLLSLQVAMFSRALEAKRKHARERAQLFEQLEQQNLELEARVAQRTESLSKALQDVQQAELSQRKLLTMASHEFRTPAAWIKASIDSLAILKDEVPAAVALRLTNMRQASLRMIGLANDLINEDRLHELSLQPRMAAMDLCQLVTEVVAVYPQKSEIAVSVPNEAVPITGDAALLRIALHNLLDNALRHGATDAGERQRIEVSLIRDNGQIQVRVADNGPGIADSKKQWVFERYHAQPYRDSADDDARVSVSSGLGLSIVREIAQAHAGTATVHDRPQGGAVFSIGLPA